MIIHVKKADFLPQFKIVGDQFYKHGGKHIIFSIKRSKFILQLTNKLSISSTAGTLILRNYNLPQH